MKIGHLALVAALTFLTACAPNTTPVTKKGYQGKPPIGTPMTFPAAAELADGAGVKLGWWWIPFDGSSAADEVAVCGDGSTTGLAVSPGTTDDLLVFFAGGGACWSYETCAAGTAIHKSFGQPDFLTEATQFIPSSITSRAHLPAAVAGATIVYVPYCTGDVHGGDNVESYGNALVGYTAWHHVGHANVMAYLKRLAATWPSPRKLVVAGSSAGGFGALVNYEAFRWYWPTAQGYLVDDSGPALVGNDVPTSLRDAWYNAWHLGVSTDPFCLDCRTDLSSAWTELSAMHRQDRLAFVSHLRDDVMSVFIADVGSVTDPTTLFQLGANFESNLRTLEAAVMVPTPNARVFYETGTDHMMLTPMTAMGTTDYTASHVTNGVTLSAWLQAMFSGAAWGSLLP